MLEFKKEYFQTETNRHLYPTTLDLSKAEVYGCKDREAYMYKIPNDRYTSNAGNIDFSLYPNGVWSDYTGIKIVERLPFFQPSINFNKLGDITPSNLNKLKEEIKKHIVDLETAITESVNFIDSGVPGQNNLPYLPEGCVWFRDPTIKDVIALPITDLYGKFNQMVEEIREFLLKLLDKDYNDTLLKFLENVKKELERQLSILAGAGSAFKPKQVANIEILKNVNAKVDEVYEVLGYYRFDDGATHKRIIANEDDGSGVQLNNKLWANILETKVLYSKYFGIKNTTPLENARSIRKLFEYANKTKTSKVIADFGEIELDVVTDISVDGQLCEGGEILLTGCYDVDFKNSILKVKTNNSYRYIVFHAKKFSGHIKNCTLIGDRSTHDYNDKTYKTHEYGHGISITSCNDIKVSNFKITDMTGDCIIIGQEGFYFQDGFDSNNIIIEGCDLSYARRNNISITCSRNVTIKNNVISNAGIEKDGVSGTAPQLGIDLEAYRSRREDGTISENSRIENVVISNNKFINNKVGALNIYTAYNVLVENNWSDTSINVFAGSYSKIINNTLINENIDKDYSNVAIAFNYIKDSKEFYEQDKHIDRIRYRNIVAHNTIIGFKQGISGTFQNTDILNNYFKTQILGAINGVSRNVKFDGNKFDSLSENILKPNCFVLEFDSGDNIISNNIFNHNSEGKLIEIKSSNSKIYFFNNNQKLTNNNATGILLTTENDNILIEKNTLHSLHIIQNSTKSKLFIKNNIFKQIDRSHYGIYGNFEGSIIENNLFEKASISEATKENYSSAPIFINKNTFKDTSVTVIQSNSQSIFKIVSNYFVGDSSCNMKDNINNVVANNLFENTAKITGNSKKINNISEKDAALSQLNTLHMLEKMKQENVYDDYISYMDEKTAYDKHRRKLDQDRQLAYKEALKENPDLTYEEFMSVQPMTLNLVEEPQPSEALKKFMEKYL